MEDNAILYKQKIEKSSSATNDNSCYMTIRKGARGCIQLNNISFYTIFISLFN